MAPNIIVVGAEYKRDLSPGAQYSGPGKIIVKYILKTFTIESCYDLRD